MDTNGLLFFVALFTFILLCRLATLVAGVCRYWVRAKYANRTQPARAD